MFRLTIDRRIGRKNYAAGNVFDLGAGRHNCIDCASRSGPVDELGYACARFVDAVTGAELPAVDMRLDEAACGVSALAFSSVAESKMTHDPITGGVVSHLDNPYEIGPPISENPILADASCSGTCAECSHSFLAYFDEYVRETYCARVVDKASGVPLKVGVARSDPALCGPGGAWFEEAPPMSDEEAEILAGGGSTFLHW